MSFKFAQTWPCQTVNVCFGQSFGQDLQQLSKQNYSDCFSGSLWPVFAPTVSEHCGWCVSTGHWKLTVTSLYCTILNLLLFRVHWRHLIIQCTRWQRVQVTMWVAFCSYIMWIILLFMLIHALFSFSSDIYRIVYPKLWVKVLPNCLIISGLCTKLFRVVSLSLLFFWLECCWGWIYDLVLAR